MLRVVQFVYQYGHQGNLYLGTDTISGSHQQHIDQLYI